MNRSKVDVVVSNWFPRFLANGIDYFDLVRTLDAVDGWDTWAGAWTATADEYERLGEQALAVGHRVTAAEHLRRAALSLQFAQFVLTEEPEQRASLQARMVRTYARCAPLLDPPAVRTTVQYGAGRTAVGYLREPTGRGRCGLVVLVPGLESTKEQFSTYEPYFLRRGVATLSVEGPGQGEGGSGVPFRDSAYDDAMRAVGAAISGLDGVDPSRVVVLGTSFGGYLALRHAALIPGLRGVVDIAGPYDLQAFESLQAVTREGFREFVGAADLDEARGLLDDVTLDGVLDVLPAPVLVVHGEQDRIIPVEHAHRIVAALGDRATARLEPSGNHSCNNVAAVVRPAVADWVADRLQEVS
ncbi:MAG: alpha/beta hydrolase family protein [Jiangellaceae bacterium]